MAEYETVNGSIGLTIVGNTNPLVDLREYAGDYYLHRSLEEIKALIIISKNRKVKANYTVV